MLKQSDLVRENRYKDFIYYEINASVFEEIMLWFTQFSDLKKQNKTYESYFNTGNENETE
mgnify:FL=1